jgi:hypothetical protein
MPKVVARYEYRDANGALLAVKERHEPKSFRWYRMAPDGTSSSGLGEMGQQGLPLYRLPDLLAATPDADGDRWVYYAEGERDADNLAALGVVATTCPEGGGSTSWPADRFAPLAGCRVVILPDNDETGVAHARAVLDAVRETAKDVRILPLPGLPEKGDVSDWLAAGGTRERLHERAVNAWTEMAEQPPTREGAALASALAATVLRFVVVSEEAATALALWIMHAHAFEASEGFTPYIQITSPTRESGKTTLIDVLEALVPNPLRADSATAAAIYRAVDVGRGRGEPKGAVPTLFLDELDTVFGGHVPKTGNAEALRQVLNSGFKREGRTLVCEGDQHTPMSFSTYCPKVLAGIGQLPDTVTSRCIPIPMMRATRAEVARLESARAKSLRKLADLHAEVARWAAASTPRLTARDEPVLGLKARHDDVWGPLLNIADLCGNGWGERARAAARVLHAETGDTTDGRDAGIALLSDLRDLFETERAPLIQSARLAELLRSMEGRPWPEYSRGGPITVHAIAKLLRPFGIGPRQERIGTEKVRAYFRSDCEEAFRRYLPPPPGAIGTSGTNADSPYENACPGSFAAGRGAVGTGALRAAHPVQSVPVVPVVPVPTGGMGGVPLGEGGYPAFWDG